MIVSTVVIWCLVAPCLAALAWHYRRPRTVTTGRAAGPYCRSHSGRHRPLVVVFDQETETAKDSTP